MPENCLHFILLLTIDHHRKGGLSSLSNSLDLWNLFRFDTWNTGWIRQGWGRSNPYPLVMWKGYPTTEARLEPQLHLQNAPLILKDYLHHVRTEDQYRYQNREGQKKSWWWLWGVWGHRSCCVLCPGAIDWHNYGGVLGAWEFGWDFFVNYLLALYSLATNWGPF